MSNVSIIKNHDLLDEDYKTVDLFNFSSFYLPFYNFLEKINKNSVVGLVGEFGSGKSTALYQLYKDKKAEDDEKWIHFDAWKYPDKNDLWEGFVLDFADALGKKSETINQIDGKRTKYGKVVSGATNVLTKITQALPIGIALNVINDFLKVFEPSPAKRVFEIQEILKKLIKGVNKRLYVIVEDIDRSGDHGIYFLETLRNFIKSINDDSDLKKIIIIAPIAKPLYEEVENNASYLKVLDYTKQFDPKQSTSFEHFIGEVFDNTLLERYQNFNRHISFLLNKIYLEDGITLRHIKNILRLCDTTFDNLEDELKEKIDIRLFVLFCSLNFYKLYKKEKIITNTKLSGSPVKMLSNPNWAKVFIYILVHNRDPKEINFNNLSEPFYFLGDNFLARYSPKNFQDEENKYLLSEYYLELLK